MKRAFILLAVSACTVESGGTRPLPEGTGPLQIDPATQKISLDQSQVPVLPSCNPGDGVRRNAAGTGWECAPVTSSSTTATLQAQVTALQAQLGALQSELDAFQAGLPLAIAGQTIPGNLQLKYNGQAGPTFDLANGSTESHNSVLYFSSDSSTAGPTHYFISNDWNGANTDLLTFGYNDRGNWTQHVSLTTDGRFGVGTTSPQSKLDVAGQIKGGGVLAGVWAAQPLNDTTLPATPATTWTDVSNTSVTFTLDRPATIFATYSINVQADATGAAIGGSFVGTCLHLSGPGTTNGRYPESGSHYQPYSGATADVNWNLNGNLVKDLAAGTFTIKLQWYAYGSVIGWSNWPTGWANGGIGGRTLVVQAFYK